MYGDEMKLEFWIDYNNPICYKQHKVLEAFFKKHSFDDLELLYRNYEMIPNFQPSELCTFYELMSKHYVATLDEVKAMYPNLTDDFRPVSVYDAHRLSHLAKKEDCAFLYHQALFDAYYDKKQDISDHHILIEIAKKAGLSEAKTIEVLSSNLYRDQVNQNRENAILKGIFELPHMRIDGKLKLSGFHDEQELYLHLKLISNHMNKHEHCEDGNCDRKKTR
jgi:predicted DsbA family dithiol-disulfide isomerase